MSGFRRGAPAGRARRFLPAAIAAALAWGAGSAASARADDALRALSPASPDDALRALSSRLADAMAQAQPPGAQAPPIVLASKPFGESFLLMELAARLLEARGWDVERRPGLGATEIAFRALRTGAIDAYPEYTGTGLVAVLGEAPLADRREVFRRVAAEFEARWGARWLPPLGFENTYAIAVRREDAERLGLRTLSDLARASGRLTAGFSPDFIGREDGLPGLRDAYGLEFAATRSLLQSVKYRALAEGEVDVIDGYSTDGLIARYDLVVLEDDRGFFPAYEAALLVAPRLWREWPAAVGALVELSGRLDEERMRELNRRVESEGESPATVAEAALLELGLLDAGDAAYPADPPPGAGAAGGGAAGGPDGRTVERGATALPRYLWDRRATLFQLVLRHLLLVGASLLAAIAVAVPAGLALERARSSAEPVIRGAGLLQTIPSIALLAFMIPLLGIGVVPALVALFLYSLYPILRNTFTGVRDADPQAVAAARALGMTELQVLRLVRLPLAAPIIMAGIRTAAVITVGTATLAAFIGAGGLGDPIVAGLALSDTRLILFGAIPAALLALVVDLALAGVERLVRPRGL